MSTTTTNLALTKPATTDTVDIAVINTNMDTLDIHRHTGTTSGLTIQTAGLADDAVTAAKIADDVVTTAHLGDQVPAVIGRQGGSATDWHVGGTDTQAVTTVRMQVGATIVNLDAGISGTLTAIAFPTAFSNKPIVFVTSSDENIHLAVTYASIAATQFVVDWQTVDGSAISGVYLTTCYWLAIGPE